MFLVTKEELDKTNNELAELRQEVLKVTNSYKSLEGEFKSVLKKIRNGAEQLRLDDLTVANVPTALTALVEPQSVEISMNMIPSEPYPKIAPTTAAAIPELFYCFVPVDCQKGEKPYKLSIYYKEQNTEAQPINVHFFWNFRNRKQALIWAIAISRHYLTNLTDVGNLDNRRFSIGELNPESIDVLNRPMGTVIRGTSLSFKPTPLRKTHISFYHGKGKSRKKVTTVEAQKCIVTQI